MKNLLFIALLSLATMAVYAQRADKHSFIIENSELKWQRVFETNLDANLIIENYAK